MKFFSSKGIRFSEDSIKSCVGFIDLVDSTKNTITMEGLENIRKYYSTFINSITETVKSYRGKIVKNIGDCLLFYFPKTTDNKNIDAFREAIECCFKILDERYSINQELVRQHLPPFNYRISIDYGVVELALVGDYSQIDLFGSTVNLCSKINSSSSLSAPNEIIMGDNIYKILKSFPTIAIVNNYDFIKNGELKITETNRYSTYNIRGRRRRKNNTELSDTNTIEKNSLTKKYPLHSFEKKDEEGFFFNKNNNNNNKKRVIIVDDEQDILLTFRTFLSDYNYQITSFTDPSLALNYIKDLSNFDDLLIILDIRMKNLNGFQLHQQIKSIDPTIKIIFITALDILDEISTIIPGISREQIMRKPVDKNLFTYTVKQLLN